MTKTLRVLSFLFVLCSVGVLVLHAGDPPSTSAQHSMVLPTDVKWEPIMPGVTMAVVSGDPKGEGPYVIRLKSVGGTKVPPHWHPMPENVTVLEGSFAVGMGDKFDSASLHEMPAGGFARIPAEMRHFALARTDCVVQVHGMAPFVINWVNPADAPKAGN